MFGLKVKDIVRDRNCVREENEYGVDVLGIFEGLDFKRKRAFKTASYFFLMEKRSSETSIRL